MVLQNALYRALIASLMLLNSDKVQAAPARADTTGTVVTSLETSGNPSSQPFPTKTAAQPEPPHDTPFSTFSTTSIAPAKSARPFAPLVAGAVDPFLPVATGAPPSIIQSRDNHPVPRLNIAPQSAPLHTNKFYANLFLGKQNQGVWTHPYSLTWSKGGGPVNSWGMAISHIDPDQRAFGPVNTAISGSPASYVINPIGIQSIILSAAELGANTQLTTDSLDTFSVNANLLPSAGASSSIKFPLVQGMGFVTGIYKNLQPVIDTGIFFNQVGFGMLIGSGVYKYVINTADNKFWNIYAIPDDGVTNPGFIMLNNTRIQGSPGWSGVLQVAKNPAGSAGDVVFDQGAGLYATGASLSGSVTGSTGSYSLSWTTGGKGSSLVMFALPHHQASFDATTKARLTSVTLATTTKGNAVAVIGSSWTMVEGNLPSTMGFEPWSANSSSTVTTLSPSAIAAIQAVASGDVNQDMGAQINLNSFYYAGKALSKFASIVWVLQRMANSTDLAAQGLSKLKTQFQIFTTNQNQNPLVYDTSWKGVVSSVWQDSGADFGNSFYNDHHFHFGYFLHAAAMVGSLDSTWLAQNKDYINTMVRDVSNPSKADNFFPVFRSFDWYHGHSWAKGLFESADSKDEESSSEDVMFAYGLKMWGKTIGDASMEARGNLMLAVLARSLRSYFLMESTNTIQPAQFIGNKVTGILFENKMDHVTYFGSNFEYVQGIHMLPLTAASVYTRNKNFVNEEWNVYFRNGGADPASSVAGGWRGILYANLALIDPRTSFQFFSQPNFNQAYLDGGASLTWYLAFAGGLGGA